MDTIEVNVELAHPFRREYRPYKAIVDTGAGHSMFPSALLEELGIEPFEETLLATQADGSIMELRIGEARIRMEDGRERTVLVMFGLSEDVALLGSTTLQLLGLAPDPMEHRLVPGRTLVVGAYPGVI